MASAREHFPNAYAMAWPALIVLVKLSIGFQRSASHRPGEFPIATSTSEACDRVAPKSRQILVVDDNVSSAETLALLIGLSGHTTQVAHTGIDALKAVESSRPDVVLLDIGLPGMDGYEVARRLRQTDANRAILLVAVTGYGQDDDRRRAHDAGFNHHLVKPLDLEQLEGILAESSRVASV